MVYILRFDLFINKPSYRTTVVKDQPLPDLREEAGLLRSSPAFMQTSHPKQHCSVGATRKEVGALSSDLFKRKTGSVIWSLLLPMMREVYISFAQYFLIATLC